MAPSRQEGAIAGLAFGGGLNLLGALVNQGALFGITLVVAQQLGTSDVGVYFQAFAVRSLLQLACLGGMRSALTLFVARYRVDKDDAAVLGTVYMGVGLSFLVSVLAAVVLYVMSPLMADQVFQDATLLEPLRIVAVSLPSAVVTVAALSATQGFRTMRAFSMVGLIFEPALRLGLTVVLLVFGFGLRGAMVAMLVAGVAAALWSVLWLRRLLGGVTLVKPRYEFREVTRFAAVSWVSSVASQGLLWADIVLIGAFLASDQVGIYQVATRLVMLAAVAVNPLNSSFAPRAADLWRRQDLDVLNRSYRATVSWMLRISIPALVALAVFPATLLSIFGDRFAVGSTVVLIFVWGELADASTSSAAVLLNMAGRNLLNMMDGLGILTLNICLNIILIPRWGIEGSAVAWSVALVTIGLLRMFQAHTIIHSFPFDSAALRGAVAGVAALVVGLLVSLRSTSAAGDAIGLALIVVTYLAVVVKLGISATDRSVLRALRTRLRVIR